VTEPVLYLATPVFGTHLTAQVNVNYHHTLLALAKSPQIQFLPCCFATDIVRARSRLCRQFLQETSGTHLLFWDADVTVPSPPQASRLINHLIQADKDVVGCTYPLRRVSLAGAAKAAAEGRNPESGAYDYPLHTDWAADENRTVTNGCLKVAGLPLGFTLVKRACLETMTEHYAPTLTFDDEVDGKVTPTVALFQLLVETKNGRRSLLGEDYSFATRWRAIGGEVNLYLGPDSDLIHVGAIPLHGSREGFFR
jgi:hypothetical protein